MYLQEMCRPRIAEPDSLIEADLPPFASPRIQLQVGLRISIVVDACVMKLSRGVYWETHGRCACLPRKFPVKPGEALVFL